ncbi:MAG: RecQ family ATP-dependent DNA helicase [Flavobacteriales bacterium]|nr:RecQ family ATP-dependent DNA helicase [Flavobacteriales bacterium]MCB9448141.1 RecQ family ATP-dependent DNA helicase [Flavobacteriales bacterium]
MNPKQILTQYWGYSSFRPLQEEIIQSVLDGKDTLALLPTGGGKSICYQVPALTLPGICIVISPLIALMKDQTEALVKKGISAKALVAGMGHREVDTILDNCIYGKIKLLYLSPERLLSPLVQARLAKMKVNLLAVDEAHCVSQWGHDFRPAYLQIASIRKFWPKTPLLALTATATEEVAADVTKQLLMHDTRVLRKSFARPNLSYQVKNTEDKEGYLLQWIRKNKGSGIVYVRTRKHTRDIASLLARAGIKASFYHAGLPGEERQMRQEQWMAGRIQVMVCTNAFGMGIDKPDVRFVVHMDMPDQVESYMQEAGRAGRDEKPAVAMLLHNRADHIELLERINASHPPFEDIRAVYQALGNFFQLPVGSGEDTSHDFDIGLFCERFQYKPAHVFHCLRVLERAGYVMLREDMFQPSRLQFLLSRQELYGYQVSHQSMDAFIKLVLRSYPGLFDDLVPVREEDLARRSHLAPQQVRDALTRMHKEEVVDYQPRKEIPQVYFPKERLHEKNLHIPPEFLKNRKELAMRRAESMIYYVTSVTRCRSIMLQAYFGEKDAKRCGVCDVCIDRNPLQLNDIEFEQVSGQLKTLLKEKNMSLSDVIQHIEGSNQDRVIKVIQWLMDHGKIKHTRENLLSWIS